MTKKTLLIQTKNGTYNIIIWWDKKDKAYLVKVPSLPGVVTFGKTLVEAKKMAKDAIELYCDCVLEKGKIIIDDQKRLVGKLPSRSRILSPVA